MRGKKKATVIISAVIFLVAGFSLPVHADAPETKNLFPLQSDTDYLPRLGTYYYCFEFNNMNIGTACIGIEREGDLYKMQVYAKTNEKIDYVYRIRYQGETLTDLDPLTPVETKIKQQVKSTEKEVVISYQNNGMIKTSEKKIKRGEVVDDEVRRVYSGRSVDPFSATYLARGLDWKKGAEQIFEVYNGKNRYELRLKCTGKVVIDMPGGKRETWVIVPTARELDVDKRKLAEKKKPADIKIYLSADEKKDVLRVEANHTMGTFLVLLDRFEPADSRTKVSSIQTNTFSTVNTGQ